MRRDLPLRAARWARLPPGMKAKAPVWRQPRADGLIGWLAGLFMTKGIQQEKRDEFRSGYELGQSNATKSLYWTLQALHEGTSQPPSQVTYYRIPADYPADGAKRTEGSIVLPVIQDK